jgi:hypothetical protein
MDLDAAGAKGAVREAVSPGHGWATEVWRRRAGAPGAQHRAGQQPVRRGAQ